MPDKAFGTSTLTDLDTAKAILQSNRTPLLSSTTNPTSSQISAARAIQNFIATDGGRLDSILVAQRFEH